MDNTSLTGDPQLVDCANRYIESLRKQRSPLFIAYLGGVSALGLSSLALVIEWKNISLALRELFPTLSNGEGFSDVTQTLALASVGAIAMGDILLANASEHWSDRARRRLNGIGVISLLLFVLRAVFDQSAS